MRRRTYSILLYTFLTLLSILIGGASGFLVYSFWDLPQLTALDEYRPSITSRVYSSSNKLLAEFYLENRTPIVMEQVPEMFVKALVATEDARFFSHHGMDFRGLARAFYHNLRARRVVEGGSTLTQQLAKVLFLTPDRSYKRKLKELALALRIEQQYTKREILLLYLNQIYFGSGAYGIEAAARTYFGKSARDLTIPECALLAGLPRSPNRYSPFRSPQRARIRRTYVLGRMVAEGAISKEQAAEADKVSLPTHSGTIAGSSAPYFVEHVRQQVEERLGSSILYTGGLNIRTTLNADFQGYAEEAVAAGLAQIEARHKTTDRPPLQAALLALDPSSGNILAMVGGRNFGKSQFNRALQAMRQPGSSFKPIVYAAALDRGMTAADILDDTPLSISLETGKVWSPENFTRKFQGPVTLRKALSQSLNVPTVRLLRKIGIDETATFAEAIGISGPLARYPSLGLGSSDMTLNDLTSTYAVFANQGLRIEPISVVSIEDHAGKTLWTDDTLPEQVMKPETAYLITNLMKGVVEHGTAFKARELGRPLAGKTGTTNDYRDAWFIGYSPTIVTGVWVGYDDHEPIGKKETGARAALPIWMEFMKKALADKPAEDFVAPDSIVFRQIDARTGMLATDKCGKVIREAFLKGTEPQKYCDEKNVAVEGAEMDEAPD